MFRLFTGPLDPQALVWPLEEVVQKAGRMPEKKFIIIVPEQATLQMQRKVVDLHPEHACMNIDVVSFDRLAHVVLAKLGKDLESVLDDVGKALILRSLLEEISEDLVVYKNKIRMQGFVSELGSLVTEFRQYGIGDSEIAAMQEEAAAGSILKNKLSDIRLICRHFNERVEETYHTAEDVLEACADSMAESDFIKGSDIYLEGFTGFTPIQYKLLGEMILQAENVTCSLTIPAAQVNPSCAEYDVFALANKTFTKLKDLAESCKVGFEHVVYNEQAPKTKHITQSGYATVNDEVRATAGEILRLVRKEGIRFRDIAVLTSDMEAYYEPVKSTFEQAGIPVFIDYKSEFADNLIVRLVMAALDISVHGLKYQQVFSFLKTGFSGLLPSELDELENYCLEFNIAGRGKWESDFTLNRELKGGGAAYDLEALNAIRRKVYAPMTEFAGRTGKPGPAARFCKSLNSLLERMSVQEKVEKMVQEFAGAGLLELSKEYEQVYGKLSELLKKIEEIIGNKQLSAGEFAGIMLNGIEEMKVGIIPPSLDSLTVGDLTRTRPGTVKHLFILGMNEGKVLQAGSGSLLFTQTERELLKNKDFDIANTVNENILEQRYYLYLAFNRPEDELVLSWAGNTGNGDVLTPSCVLSDLDELVPGAVTEDKDPVPVPKEGMWKAEALRQLAYSTGEFMAGRGEPDEIILEYFAKESPEELKLIFEGAGFSSEQSPLDPQVALDLYGDVLKGSVSRFESYFNCPYRHFLTYGLGLEARREYAVKATDLGTIYHEALENYSKSLKEKGLTFRSISDEESKSVMQEAVTAAIDALPGDILSSTARNEYFKGRITEIASKTADVLRSHVNAGRFEPDEFEYFFDEPVTEDIRFRGLIDRVDIYDAGDIFVKIIDYKSGNKEFDIKDIYSGLQLQLVAYLGSAIRKEKEKNPGRNVRPGGVYYYLISDKYTDTESEKAKKHKMSGLTSCEQDIPAAIDEGLAGASYSSSIIPVSTTKDGLKATSILANEGEFNSLMDFVHKRITEAGNNIRNGDISLTPFREKDKVEAAGCRFCDYEDVCKYESGCMGSASRTVELSSKEMEDEIYGRS